MSVCILTDKVILDNIRSYRMDVKFYSNKISLKGEKFEDFIQKQLHKTASSNKVVKTAAAEKDEADSSGQPEVEGKLVNKPKNDEKAAKSTKSKKCDEAESSGQLAVEPKHQKGESEKAGDLPCKTKKSEADGETKEAGIKGKCKECGKPNFLCKCKGKKDKKAATSSLVKIAKLDDKTRSFLKTYWLNLYPAEYVDAMLSEQ